MITLNTVADIKAFQRKHKLVVDGIGGPQTRRVLAEVNRPPKPLWPMQSKVDDFYGNPRGQNGNSDPKWEKENLVSVSVPFKMVAAWDKKSVISKIRIHRNCAESLSRVLAAIWDAAGRNQKTIDAWGVNLFGGSFAFRVMRGGSRLSMHSWACAIDFDPARNGLGDYTPVLTPDHPVAIAFKNEGWVHGADWNGNQKVMDERRPDAMHFQAARV